jgi:hypothetical protein
MAESSLHFNFDDFEAQIDEALEENARKMHEVHPGEIGGVATEATLPPRVD